MIYFETRTKVPEITALYKVSIKKGLPYMSYRRYETTKRRVPL